MLHRPTRPHLLLLALCCLAATPAWAGRSRPVYVDGGQSADGRYVVTAELIEEPVPGGKGGNAIRRFWRFTWKDTRDGATSTGVLVGLHDGKSQQQTPVHAHIYVAPDGQTFAVWNPQAYASLGGGPHSPFDDASEAFRNDPAFSHRLTIYRRSGEVVKAMALKDFLQESEWGFVIPGQVQRVHWLQEYPGLTDSTVPRVGYAFHRISPDHTVLECTIGFKAGLGGNPRHPEVKLVPRTVRVSLIDGHIFTAADTPTDEARVPVRPFVGEMPKGPIAGREMMHYYRPSLDPVRVAGAFTPIPAGKGKAAADDAR